MKSDLSFLKEKTRNVPGFQTAWLQAVKAVHNAAQADLDRKSAPRKKAIRAEAERTFGAAKWIRDEIDAGDFAGLFSVDDFVNQSGFHQVDVPTVRRFLNLLMQQTRIVTHLEVDQIPTIVPKRANPMAGYFVGRLCAQFGLGEPKRYVPDDLSKANVAIRLMRCLLIDARADHEPSSDTLLRGMVSAKKSFTEFLECKTTSSD